MSDPVAQLILALDRVPPPQLADEATTVLRNLGLIQSLTVWVVDYSSRLLTDLAGAKPTEEIAGTRLGAVIQTLRPELDGRLALLPINRRGRVFGVVEFELTTTTTVDQLEPIVLAIADAVVASGQVSDVFARSQRADRLSLAATLQHQNLPPSMYLDSRFDIGAGLEPAYDIAGDVIDYAINPEGVHLAMFDAVGHGLRSTTLSSWTVGTYRALRRRGAPIEEIASQIDQVVADNGREFEFVTGLILTLHGDHWTMFNAGHPPPLLIQGGESSFVAATSTQPPFGLGLDPTATTTIPFQVESVLMLYSDGVIQARDPELAQWGEVKLAAIAVEALQEERMDAVCRRVLSGVIGWVSDDLADDASIVGIKRLR